MRYSEFPIVHPTNVKAEYLAKKTENAKIPIVSWIKRWKTCWSSPPHGEDLLDRKTD